MFNLTRILSTKTFSQIVMVLPNNEIFLLRSHVALIAQLGEHCTGIAEVVSSNPAQSLKIFSRLCSSSVTAAFALLTVIIALNFNIFY